MEAAVSGHRSQCVALLQLPSRRSVSACRVLAMFEKLELDSLSARIQVHAS